MITILINVMFTILIVLTLMASGTSFFVMFLNSLSGYTAKLRRKRAQKKYDQWFNSYMDRRREN